MRKFLYYCKKFRENFKIIMSKSKIKNFGFSICFLDFCIFLMHRNRSFFAKRMNYWKDKKVQRYLVKNYGTIIRRYSDIEGGADGV